MNAQVGIGTTTPQAQLEVSGGNVRFSSYGTGSQLSTNGVYLLGVEPDGDIIEATRVGSRGLQFYTWNTGNVSSPNISNPRSVGMPTSSGLLSIGLNEAARASVAPDGNGYILRFSGVIQVQNTGSFTINARSDDGTRVYVDDILVVDNWFDQPATTRSGTFTLAQGDHKIEFWYYENDGGDFMQFTWGANPDGYTLNSVINANQFFVK